MPAGDPQRTWFPEMLEILRTRWHVGLPFAKLIELRDELDTMLHRIRGERHIRPPVIRCPQCGHVGEAAEPDVSVRAMILSLRRFGMAPAEHVKMLEKRWPHTDNRTGSIFTARRRSQRRLAPLHALIQMWRGDVLRESPPWYFPKCHFFPWGPTTLEMPASGAQRNTVILFSVMQSGCSE